VNNDDRPFLFEKEISPEATTGLASRRKDLFGAGKELHGESPFAQAGNDSQKERPWR
jgi:hypothetical protein